LPLGGAAADAARVAAFTGKQRLAQTVAIRTRTVAGDRRLRPRV